MTKKEALQVLAILKAAYPANYNGMTKEEATGTVGFFGAIVIIVKIFAGGGIFSKNF